MCGITGIFETRGAEVDPACLETMTRALAHRGPDESGLWTGPSAGFGHRRLSIIDLVSGQQPMSNPEGTRWITFNGEIYNYRELRRELEAVGTPFRTNSDTEVLLHLFAKYGPRMLDRLIGMFAFAVFDVPRQQLFLARDRLGKKPLFYFLRDGRFAFASELQALRHAPGFPTEVRTESVAEYLTYQYVPCPHTIFRQVRKLPPGTFLQVAAGQSTEPEPQRYWNLRFKPTYGQPIEVAAEELRSLLADAVRLRLVADVPVGAFLSGGIDSTCVTGLMAERLHGQEVRTFTIGFPEREFDERRFAAISAARFRTTHGTRIVDPQDFAAVQLLVRHHGEPYADASMLPAYLLSRFAREEVKVVLSGDGADEVLGGYERYQALRFAGWLDGLPPAPRRAWTTPLVALLGKGRHERTWQARLQRFLTLVQMAPGERYFHLVAHFLPGLQHDVYGPRLQEAASHPAAAYLEQCLAATTTPESAARAAEVDLHSYLVNDILPKVDIASMAASLEVRSPFLDHRVVEFAASLPWTFKQRGWQRKRILLRACRDLLPPAIRRRGKKGFGVPLARWFREDWQALLREILLDPVCARRGFFRPAGLRGLIDAHTTGRADCSSALWTLLVFELWCQEWDIR